MSGRGRGFTLLELLVVLVIVGVAVSAAAWVRHDPARARLAEEARRLAALVALARDEAVLRGTPLALELGPTGYRFLAWDGAAWTPIATGPLRPRRLPRPVKAAPEDGEGLPVVLDTTGDLPPFRAVLRAGALEASVGLDEEGRLRLDAGS
ncbi:GspH/FimT family pseudopilin [Inmirania thermothiophila]|uniref:Type II secretion system protein H n=1 Tax=Inmirania thermothiophila TaxID=1750597 RepID=A0A3N1XXA7_9GAMM|nr:GspH/FimT family pseudopilin [Inmirania thermothiophila]ROR29567.1 type II secretion system protein H [Inmirania thermothiophila]